MSEKLKKLLPPGSNVKTAKTVGILTLTLFILSSFVYLYNFLDAYEHLFYYAGESKFVHQGAKMPLFGELFRGRFFIIYLALCFAIAMSIANFKSFTVFSKSIYVMKRVPDKYELLRRCIGGPLLFLVCVLLIFLLFTVFYYLLYMHVPPRECIVSLSFFQALGGLL